MPTSRKRLAEWLRDAHAAEEQAHSMLTGTAGRIKNYPEFKSRLNQHGEHSAQQADRLKECLSNLDEGTSILKDLTGKGIALGQTLSGIVVGDEVVKAALAISTFAQMEVSSYRILVAAAETAEEITVAQLCDGLLAEEVEFLDWLDQQLPSLTKQYLGREDAADVTAKH